MIVQCLSIICEKLELGKTSHPVKDKYFYTEQNIKIDSRVMYRKGCI